MCEEKRMIDTIICGDCLEVMPTLEDNSVDMVLADLPYGVTDCKWDIQIPLDKLWLQFERIIKPLNVVVFTSTQPYSTDIITSKREWFKYEWVWDKSTPSNPQLANKRPLNVHETLLVFSKKRTPYNPQMVKKETPIDRRNWKFTKGIHFHSESGDKCKRLHTHSFPTSILHYSAAAGECNGVNRSITTQKPIALFEYIIKTYTNEGDTVLDPTAGSGTTAVACHKSNRHYICIEKEPEYCAIAEKRIAEML